MTAFQSLPICSWCGKEVKRPNYIALIREGERICRSCYSPSVSDGSNTANSDRIDSQRRDNKADFVPPHVWDKSQKKLVINPDFVKLYPEKLRYYEKSKDVKEKGYPKLANYIDKQNKMITKSKAKFEGNQMKGMAKLLGK